VAPGLERAATRGRRVVDDPRRAGRRRPARLSSRPRVALRSSAFAKRRWLHRAQELCVAGLPEIIAPRSSAWRSTCASSRRGARGRERRRRTGTAAHPAAGAMASKAGVSDGTLTLYLPFERRSAHLFFQLVSRRYERGSLLITTNQPVIQW